MKYFTSVFSVLLTLVLMFFHMVVDHTNAYPQSLTVSWTDNSNNEEGFILERGDITVQPDQTFLATNFAEITRPVADSTNHVDTTINQGQFYCYRVAAFITVTNATPPEAKSTFSNIGCGVSIVITLTIQGN